LIAKDASQRSGERSALPHGRTDCVRSCRSTRLEVVRAFGRVESAFQFLVLSWSTVIELMSVYKRLRAFERQIDEGVAMEPVPAREAQAPG